VLMKCPREGASVSLRHMGIRCVNNCEPGLQPGSPERASITVSLQSHKSLGSYGP
jgi:hypothetical protein